MVEVLTWRSEVGISIGAYVVFMAAKLPPSALLVLSCPDSTQQFTPRIN